MKKQKGLTLIELMISMVIGLLVVGTVITIFLTNVRSNSDNVRMIKLNQELRGVMAFMSDELKRAGYSADPTEDGFMNEYNLATNCIRYSYDENGNGVLDSSGLEQEYFGFRGVDTDSDSVVDTIQWSRTDSTTDCSASTGWESITEPDILEITSVTVDDGELLAGTVNIQQLTITIIGQALLSSNTVASREITEVIRIRNDDA